MPIDTQMAAAKSSDADAAPLDVLTKAVGPATLPDEGGDSGHDDGEDQAQSSGATDDETSPKQPEEKDLLSVVRDAVEGKKDPEPAADKKADPEAEDEDAPSASGKSDAQKKPDASEAGEDEISAEELAEYKPKVRKRIEGLLSERRELREEAATYREPAEQYQKISSYMETNGLTANDVATAFTLTAMFKHDPERAREELMKRVEMLDSVIGNKLSDDLHKKVEDGFLDEESAREISRSRAAAQREREKREFVEQRTEQERQRQLDDSSRSAVQQTVQSWQQSKMQADPEFSQKAELIEANVKALVAQYGQPKTPDQAIQMAEIAYGKANQIVSNFRPAAPPPQPKRVVQSRHISGQQRPAPSSPLDVVKAAVENAK